MKKTLTLLAIMAAIGPAWAADVISSNVVGYNKVTLQAGYNLLGQNWNLVGGGDGLITSVLDATNLSGVDIDTGDFTSQIQMWTGSGYEFYGWAGDIGDEYYNYKWLDESTLEPVSLPTPKGTAFWIKAGSAADVMFSGEVATNQTFSIPVAAGYNMLANPFPKTISIQQIQSADLSGVDVDTGDFTSYIQIWTGSGYEFYGWAGNIGDDYYNYKWLDESTLEPVTDVNLGIGQGCWIKTGSEANIVFTK